MDTMGRHVAAAVGSAIRVIRYVRSAIIQNLKPPQIPRNYHVPNSWRCRASKPMLLSDRQERIQFLRETIWGTIPGTGYPFHEELAIVCAVGAGRLSSSLSFCVFGRQFLDLKKSLAKNNKCLLKYYRQIIIQGG